MAVFIFQMFSSVMHSVTCGGNPAVGESDGQTDTRIHGEQKVPWKLDFSHRCFLDREDQKKKRKKNNNPIKGSLQTARVVVVVGGEGGGGMATGPCQTNS